MKNLKDRAATASNGQPSAIENADNPGVATAPTPKIITKQDVADMCHVTTRTVDRWRKLGKLRGATPGNGAVRFLESDVYAMLAH